MEVWFLLRQVFTTQFHNTYFIKTQSSFYQGFFQFYCQKNIFQLQVVLYLWLRLLWRQDVFMTSRKIVQTDGTKRYTYSIHCWPIGQGAGTIHLTSWTKTLLINTSGCMTCKPYFPQLMHYWPIRHSTWVELGLSSPSRFGNSGAQASCRHN